MWNAEIDDLMIISKCTFAWSLIEALIYEYLIYKDQVISAEKVEHVLSMGHAINPLSQACAAWWSQVERCVD